MLFLLSHVSPMAAGLASLTKTSIAVAPVTIERFGTTWKDAGLLVDMIRNAKTQIGFDPEPMFAAENQLPLNTVTPVVDTLPVTVGTHELVAVAPTAITVTT